MSSLEEAPSKSVGEVIPMREPSAQEKVQQEYNQSIAELGHIEAQILSHELALKDLNDEKRGVRSRVEKILKKAANIPQNQEKK